MKWKILSIDNSMHAIRHGIMLGMEVCQKPEGTFDGLIVFGVPVWCKLIYNPVPTIFHWTGSDAKIFLDNSKMVINFGNALHITNCPWIASRLTNKISPVHFVPLFPYLPVLDIELKKSPGLYIYINQHKARDIARTQAVIRLIRDIPIYISPGIRPSVIGSSFQDNIIDVGWVSGKERNELFSKVSVYLRLMYYDGLGQSVVEMKMLGRHVFYTNPAAFCNWVKPENSPEEIARRIMNQINKPLDMEGATWYRSIFTKEKFLEILKPLCIKKGWDFPYG